MKKFLSILLSMCMIFSCVSYAIPVFDTVESADTNVFVEDTATADESAVTLSAAGTAKPGINTWTGTESAFTFDDSVIGDFNISGTTTLEGDGDKYMLLNSGLAHFTLKNTATIPADRKVKVTFQYSAPERKTVALIKNKMYSATPTWGQKYAPVTGANSWNNYYTQDITGTDLDAEDINFIVIMAVSAPISIDNVSVVPYYRVTYDANGGTGAPAAEWWLPSTAGANYSVSATEPTRAGYLFAGWSLDGISTVTEVTPANEDITLVALWEDATARPGINIWTGTTAAFTFDNASRVTVSNGSVTTDPTNEANNIALLKAWGSMTHKNTSYGIEADRPVELKFDFYATGGSFYLYVNGDSGTSTTNRYATFAYNPKNQWYTKTFTITASKASDGWAGGDVLNSVNLRNWGDAGDTYIDNVSVTPYYKVTYDAKGGTGAPNAAWWLPASGENYAVSATAPALDGYIFKGWSLDGVNAVTEVVPENKDITLVALWEKKPVEFAKPGLNVWTGTTEAYTFDNATAADLHLFGSSSLVANGDDKYVEFAGSSSHFTLKKSLPVIDKDRQVKVTFKAQADEAAAKSVFLVRNTMNKFDPSLGLVYTTITTSWATYTKDIIGSSADVTNNSSVYTDDTQDIKNLILISQSNNTSNKMRIDDVSVVPYYRVTYDAKGGEGAPDAAWWLPATAGANYTVSTAAPTKSGYAFAGWSLDGVNAVTEVVPANEDFTLVALWADLTNIDTTVTLAAPVAGATAQTTVAGAGYTGTVTWDPALTDGKFAYETAYTATVALTLDALYTAGAVAENGYKVAGATVTNTAGATTFTAAFPATEKEPVKVVQPGLNIFTGTTDVLTFENAADYASIKMGSNAEVMTKAKDDNADNKAIALKKAWANFTIEVPTIEKDRPVKIGFDFIYGAQFRVVVNGDDFNNKAIRTVYQGSTSTDWQTATAYTYYGDLSKNPDKTGYKTSNDINKFYFMSLGDPSGENYIFIDNLKIIPGYKINYNANGGTGTVEPDYFMEGTYTALDNGATLSNGTKKFMGWSLSENGEVVSSVTGTPGSDITLFAIWADLTNIDVNVTLAAPVAGATAQTTVAGTGYTGTVTWNPALAGGKFAYNTAYTATVALTLDALYTAGAVTENGYVVSGATVTNAAGATTFTAKFDKTEVEYAKPGLNVWTGTTEAYTFDNATAADLQLWGSSNLVANGDNKYVEFAGTSSHFTLKKSLPVIDKDRPVKVTFKAQADEAAAKSVFLVRNTLNNFNPSLGMVYTTIGTSWATYTKEIIGSSAAVTNNSSIYTDDTQDIKHLILISQSNNTTNKMRIDDVSIVPAYKLTYDANGGTGEVAPAYFFDKYSNLDNGAALSNGTQVFLGWSTTAGGDVVTSVTGTPGSDVTLYAVWYDIDSAPAVEYTFTSEVAGVADGSITLTAPAGYTTANIYFADDNGILAGYTAFAKDITISNRVASYVVTGNRAFAAGATKLHVVFSGDGVEDATEVYEIPAAHRMAVEAPLYKYFVISDTHLGGSATNIDYYYGLWQETNPYRVNAMGNAEKTGDVFSNGADFVIINGDILNYGGYIHDTDGDVGEARYWDVLDKYIDERLNNQGIPVFLTNGNHEFFDQTHNLKGFHADRALSSFQGQVDYLDETYGNDIVITRDTSNPDALYYAVDMFGAKYIFMSTPEMSEDRETASHTVSAKQLKFVEDQLYDGEKSNKTIFVLTHLPLYNITNRAEVEAIFAKHPNAIVFNSHTHENLNEDYNHTVVGDMVNSFTTSDTGSVISSAGISAGQFVEVYADKVVIKARKFDPESKFIGNALYVVNIPNYNANVHTTSIDGTIADGETLTALVNGSVPADDAGYTYEWTIAGTVVSRAKTFTLEIAPKYLAQSIRLRVTAADGTYSSCISDAIVETSKTLNTASLRTKDNQGIRYAGYVSKSMRDIANVEEYGYIVAAEYKFDNGDYSELKFNANGDVAGELDNVAANYASAAAYTKGGRDYSELLTVEQAKEQARFSDAVLSGIDETGYYFSAVVTNIPEEHYNDKLVGKTYIKVNGSYYYGEAIAMSIYEVAVKTKANCEATGKEVPQYVLDVIAAVDGTSGN